MTTEEEQLMTRLYLAVKNAQCRCQFERNARGVPTWYRNPDTNGLERRRVSWCERCRCVEEYRQLIGEAV